MRNFSIDIIWAKIQAAITALGGWLGYFLGGMDGLLIALLVFVILDYITGVMRAIAEHKLSSAIGFKGICRKVLIFALVGVGHLGTALISYGGFADYGLDIAAAFDRAMRWVERCDRVIDAGVEIGETNRRMRELIAAAKGKVI